MKSFSTDSDSNKPTCWIKKRKIHNTDYHSRKHIYMRMRIAFSCSAILCSQTDSLRSHVILHERLAFYSVFLNIHQSGVLTALTWLVPHETAVVSVQVLCTPYNHAWCHFMQSCMRKGYACLAVTCHLHFWQNDQDLLHATVVTWGWNGYWNKSQHRKVTLENRTLPLLQQGFEPVTFQSQVQRSNHWAILLPGIYIPVLCSPPPCTPTHVH